ncbi:Emerin -like protein 1 [Toxocara canis]|uniref:Emerin-like protein 1 n=1 Tax=Toxocara canis TaxID=6265 RepID=A0A0B2V523_TOXCA|nr:Emerin -like protein 1 [Toxocara canis]
MINVDELSNDQIREQLIELGVSVGPVLNTTRTVYANKLKRKLEEKYGSGDAHADSRAPDEGTEEFVHVRMAAVQSSQSPEGTGPTQRISPEQISRIIRRRSENERSSSSESDLCGEESSRLLTPEEIGRLNATARSVTYISEVHKGSHMGARTVGVNHRLKQYAPINTWNRYVTIPIVAVVAVFIFFVVENLITFKNGSGNYEEL